MAFDPNKPFKAVSKPAFDPNKPFNEVKPRTNVPAADVSDPLSVKALDAVGTQLQMLSDAVTLGVDSIPGMGYLKQAQAAIAAPIKGQSYEETVKGYQQDTAERWDRNPVAGATGTLMFGGAVPVAGGANAFQRVLTQGAVNAADQAARSGAGLDGSEAAKGGLTAGIIQAGVESLPYVGKAAKATGGYLRDKTGSVGFGVRGDATREYLQNPNAMRELIDAEEDALISLKAQVDDAYRSKVAEPLDQAKQGYDDAVMEYANEKARLKNVRPPEEMASGIVDNIRGLDKDLSRQSGEAFNKLEGVNFNRQELATKIDKMKNRLLVDGQAPIAGDRQASWNALSKVQEMLNTGKTEMDPMTLVSRVPELKGQDLKKVLQAMDDMSQSAYTTYGTRTAAGKIKNARGELNQLLTDASTEYRDAMVPLAEDTRLVQGLKEVFGSEEAAQAALRSTANPDTNQRMMLLLRSLDQRTGSNYSGMLEDYINSQSLLRDPERANMMQAMMLNPAKRQLNTAEQTASNFGRLGQGSSENALKSASRGKNIETNRQLNELMGEDFLDNVKQYGLAQDFLKTSTNGSRRVNFGGLIGGPIGGTLGAVTDIHGGQIWQGILDGQIKVEQLLESVEPAVRPMLQKAAERGPQSLAAAYMALTRKPEQ